MAKGRATVEAAEDAAGVKAGEGLRDQLAEPDQADMFAAEAEDFARQFPTVAEKRGRGRPKGSQNRTTKDTLRLLQAQGFTDPLLFLARVMSMRPDELKSAYGLKGTEALSAQLRAAADLAPFIHSKQPQGVKLDGFAGAAVVLNFGQGWETAPPDIQGGRTVEGEAVEYETAAPDISSTCDDAPDEVTQGESRTDD